MEKIEEISKMIKKFRKEKNVTLKMLSEKTELSISFLSQVERGVSSMTVTSLKKIADALEVSMKDLLSYEESSNFVNKKNNPMVIRIQENYSGHQIVSGKFDGRKMEGIMYTIAPKCCDMEAFSHSGEELHYVVSGSGIFSVADESYELEEGETIHFPSTLSHKVVNPNDVELKILSVLIPVIF